MRRICVICVISFGLGFLGLSNLWAAAAPAVPAAPVKSADLFEDKVIAKGKGFEIKRSQLDDTVTSIRSTAIARGQSIPPEQMAMMEQQVMERLIQIQLLLTKATDA